MTNVARPQFGLTGPSIALDAKTHAARGDLADIALAGKLFVPHYARPMEMICIAEEAAVQEAADAASSIVASLSKGDPFMAVDMAGQWVWGFRTTDHRVGYVLKTSLGNGK